MAHHLFLKCVRILPVLLFAVWMCFAGCAPRGTRGGPVEGGPEVVEGGVIFRFYDRNAETVHLVGDFNQWTPTADPLVDKNGDGEWTLFFPLSAGIYEYKFIVDKELWVHDPKNPVSVPDGFNGKNSVVKVLRKS
jgi:1,4-alpha-glucan branching enzyme